MSAIIVSGERRSIEIKTEASGSSPEKFLFMQQ
jgi:hypothetical protein